MAYMRDADGRRLDGMVAGTRASTIAWLGDSITFAGGGPGTPQADRHAPNGFTSWAQFFTGHRLSTLINAGVQGETTAQILARVPSVLSLNPGWCHVLAGTNDISNAVPLATIKANLAAIWEALDAKGVRVVGSTIPPRNTYTGTQLADLTALNVWIRNQGRKRRNLLVVDYHAALASASGTGWRSISTPDGIHPGTLGAARMGQALAAILGPHVTNAPDLFASEGDTSNVLLYNRFTQGVVGSGAPPTGWTQSFTGGTVDFSRVPRTDGIDGSWLNLSVPAGVRGNISNPNSLLSAGRFAIGETVQAVMEIATTGIDQSAANGTAGLQLMLQALGPNDLVVDMFWNYGTSENMPLWDHAGVLRTPPLVVPAGTTQLKVELGVAGGRTLRIDRAGIVNLSRRDA